ncbi:MAG: ceramidase domain-containing protein [Elusimicrobia bacterium]|nr:ceramidase domain-containing protein [Elusimicrobiota bacterium]
MRAPNRRTAVLLLIAAAAVIATLLHGRVPQDPAYHLFADTRAIAGVANFWDVFSNLPFLLVGVYGLTRVPRLKEPRCKSAYTALSLGVLLVSLGSAYYHHDPSTATLLWDRLPMTVAFMALFSMLLEERVIGEARSLRPLLAVGVAAAVYWYWTETRGAGDLRPYILVQFLPIVLMPFILMMFPAEYLNNKLLVSALILYAAAKVCESFDRQVLASIGVLSGHTIKHLLSAAAALGLVEAVPAGPRLASPS